LKANFSAAYYLAAQTYELIGDREEALENYIVVLQLQPDNEEVQKKVEELMD
jgi:tetratricopeptide (TPR) repeat protein